MDRTVPTSGNEEINLYIRTYYSLLRSTREVQIKTLIEAHKRTNSALHVAANKAQVDMNAFIYAVLRLPDCIHQTHLVIMGQSAKVFARHGYDDVESWQSVSAPGRRRRSFFDGEGTLAVYIASRSDIDDLAPTLTAFQIEREKMHRQLSHPQVAALLQDAQAEGRKLDKKLRKQLADETDISHKDLKRLKKIWEHESVAHLLHIARYPQEIAIRSLAGSLAEYKRATRRWWRNVETKTPDIAFDDRPIYFVSSNTHTLANLLSGYALQQADTLEAFINARGSDELRREYYDILEQNVPSSRENFLYYVLKKYEALHPETEKTRIAAEEKMGITRVPSRHAFDIEVQVVDMHCLDPEVIDRRLCVDGVEHLRETNALIINIDYPLGMAAYQVLTEMARNIAEVRGIYVMGKAATLNGRIGDVMLPNVVHDEHSLNTYLFQNCFSAADVAPYLIYGTVIDNQKAITSPGTFLQNEGYMSVFYQEGYTDMEMEAGPYLSGIYEMVRPKRHPYNEIVNLYYCPFPVGFIHYASDTPFSKGKNLGAQSLSYFGMDPTYASMIAILRAIFAAEVAEIARTRGEQKEIPETRQKVLV